MLVAFLWKKTLVSPACSHQMLFVAFLSNKTFISDVYIPACSQHTLFFSVQTIMRQLGCHPELWETSSQNPSHGIFWVSEQQHGHYTCTCRVILYYIWCTCWFLESLLCDTDSFYKTYSSRYEPIFHLFHIVVQNPSRIIVLFDSGSGWSPRPKPSGFGVELRPSWGRDDLMIYPFPISCTSYRLGSSRKSRARCDTWKGVI